MINSTLIDVTSGRDDIKEILIPVNDIAIKLGNPKVANMVMLAAFVEATRIVTFKALEKVLDEKMGGRKKDLLELNHRALDTGRKFIQKGAA